MSARAAGVSGSESSAVRTSLRIDLVAAAWEAESAEHRSHISDLATALSRQGHRVALHIRRTAADLPASERARAGFEVVRVPAGPASTLSKAGLLSHLDEFASALDHEWAGGAPDLVHLHSWLSGLAVRETDVPLVQSFHGLEPTDSSTAGVGRLVELEGLTALAADRVIAASSDEVVELTRVGVPRSRMTLVPWGVDSDVFTPDGPSAPRGGTPRVLALGEVAPHSGFDTAIKALTAVPHGELLVVGPIRSSNPRKDPEVTRLVRLARKHNVDHRVRFTGQVPRKDLPALLRSADVALCVPSREPSGIGALQAMACGVPVIATATGALTDLVIDTLTGTLVPPRDTAELSQALRDLLADPVRREVYSISSADRAHTRYSWDRVATEAVSAYRKTVTKPQDHAIARRS
jgi:glycosyltransferase involved in cell wall biosynthesis